MILGIKFLNQLVILKMFLFKKSNTMFIAKHYLRKTESGYSLRKESDKENFFPSIEINLLNGRILPIIPEPISNRIVSPSVNPFIRQGDVLIAPLTYGYGIANWFLHPVEIAFWRDRNFKRQPNLIVAQGEVTGHKHIISKGKAELYERDGLLYLRVLSPQALLTHEEHHSVTIPKGNWVIRLQREYELQTMSWRSVAD